MPERLNSTREWKSPARIVALCLLLTLQNKKSYWSQRDNTVIEALALHVADPGLIPETSYGFSSTTANEH